MDFKNKFQWNCIFKTLIANVNQADMAFDFRVKYLGKEYGQNPKLNEKLDLFVRNGGIDKPFAHVKVGDWLAKDNYSGWHILSDQKRETKMLKELMNN